MNRLAEQRKDESQHQGGTLVSTDGKTLALKAAELRVSARAGVARVTLFQTFANSHDAPLAVRYVLPLPADGAVSGFSFTVGDQRVDGQIERRPAARERYEKALIAGNTAALLEQTRTSLFEQALGNIPSGQEIRCEISIDQPLKWLGSGQWEWRFPTVVGPRYLGRSDPMPDASSLQTEASLEALPVRMALSLAVGDTLSGPVSSPSHPIVVKTKVDETNIELSNGARLDRDVVIRWKVASLEAGVALDVARPSTEGHQGASYGLLTLVPPESTSDNAAVPRDLIVLVDTSGSMAGAPLAQATRVVKALIDSLLEHDRLELIEFSYQPRRWQPEPMFATADAKRAATHWVDSLSAGGGTEMTRGLLEAMSPLRTGSQRQILLITDGYIGFERQIVEAVVARLPPSCRIHTLGVGSAVNRTLTQSVARAGGGEEAIIGIGEDVEPAIERLGRRLNRPLVTELSIDGNGVLDVVPTTLPDLYAGSPALVGLRLDGGGGRVRVKGKTSSGHFVHEVTFPGSEPGEGNQAIAALYGREKVEDLEIQLTAGGTRSEIDRQIEKVGLLFQLSTRLTSWVGIGGPVESTEHLIHEQMPHEIPHGVSASGAGYGGAVLPEGHELTKTKVTAVSRIATRLDNKEACLVMIYGEDLGKRFHLNREATLIGRASIADIHIDHDSVSRNHCKLLNTGSSLILRDEGSTNGTYVNDEPVDEYVLRDGDYIKVGRCILKFLTGDNIENAYHEEIYRLTTIDGLTQTYNKRYFLETLEREAGRAQRYRRQLSLMIFDIDKFKHVNDTMGHLAGDSVLRQLASIVKKRVRRDDVFARYGGEEFAIVLPEMSLQNALVVAEKIRALVEKATIEFEGQRIPITISIGVATLQADWTLDKIINEADANLYKAKSGGRNRVVG